MVNIFQAAMKKTMTGRRIKQKDLAGQLDISIPYVNDLIRGRKAGQESVRRSIAKALGYADYESFLDIGRYELGEELLRSTPAFSTEINSVSSNGEFFRVPYSDHMTLNPESRGYISITEDIKSSPVMVHAPSLGVRDATNLQAFKLTSDAMAPVINQGAIIVVDVSQNDALGLHDRQIYVACWDMETGECAAQRLSWVGNKHYLAIESANPLRQTIYRHPHEVQLVGRVIWSCCAPL